MSIVWLDERVIEDCCGDGDVVCAEIEGGGSFEGCMQWALNSRRFMSYFLLIE